MREIAWTYRRAIWLDAEVDCHPVTCNAKYILCLIVIAILAKLQLFAIPRFAANVIKIILSFKCVD